MTNENFHYETVDINIGEDMQLRVFVDQTLNAIVACNTQFYPTIYTKGNRLARLVFFNGKYSSQLMNKDALYSEIVRRVNYYRLYTPEEINKWQIRYQIEHPGQPLPIMEHRWQKTPPKDVITSLFENKGYPGLNEIIGVSSCPIIDLCTGDIHYCDNFDAGSQMFYGSTGLVIPPVPDNPTPEEIQTALALLKETIIDFPFVKSEEIEVNRTNMLGLLICAVIRPSIPGNIPIHLIDKPTPGTGAGLLCETVSLIASGSNAPMMTPPATDEEWSKVIVGNLIAGNLFCYIDNIDRKVDFTNLASTVTCGVHRGRVLGTNIILEAPHRILWILNGNNVAIGGDLGRRIVWIRMNAMLTNPAMRKETDFHHNQIPWITENRGAILSAVYTLVRAWVRAGSPAPNDAVPNMGSFEEYRRIIGGVLQNAGCQGFLANSLELLENIDVDTEQWSTFISVIFERMADWDKKSRSMIGSAFSKVPTTSRVEFTTADIIDVIEYERDPYRVGDRIKLQDALPDNLADEFNSKKNFNRVFGRSMRKHIDRVFNEKYMLGRSDNKADNKAHWIIKKIS